MVSILLHIQIFSYKYYSLVSLPTFSTLFVQNVPPAILLRFLREHRSEWADNNMDVYSAAAIKVGPCSLPGSRVGNYGGQVILPLAHTIEHEEVMTGAFYQLQILRIYYSLCPNIFFFKLLIVSGSH